MEHLWTIAARTVIVAQNGTISLIEILETINVVISPEQKRPRSGIGLPLQFGLMTMWIRSDQDKPERGRARAVIHGPNGKEIKKVKPVEYNIDLTNSSTFRATINFQNFPYTGEGLYRILVQSEVDNKWRDTTFYPILITEAAAEQPEQ